MPNMVERLNPFRYLVDWLKRLVVDTAAAELATDVSVATGQPVEPLVIDVEAKPPKRLPSKKK